MQIKLVGGAWCSGCAGMKQTLDSMGLSYDYVDIDTTEGSEFALQHRVRSLPTMVIDYKGTTTVVVGAKNKAFLEGLIEELSNG